MALAEIRPVDTQQRIRDLLLQLGNVDEQTRMLEETRECVKQYERIYNVPSEDIHRAIDAGELVETLDVCRWIFLYNLLSRVEGE
jgi:hypothetical protein